MVKSTVTFEEGRLCNIFLSKLGKKLLNLQVLVKMLHFSGLKMFFNSSVI